jgi:hypothetical protein
MRNTGPIGAELVKNVGGPGWLWEIEGRGEEFEINWPIQRKTLINAMKPEMIGMLVPVVVWVIWMPHSRPLLQTSEVRGNSHSYKNRILSGL